MPKSPSNIVGGDSRPLLPVVDDDTPVSDKFGEITEDQNDINSVDLP